MHLNNKKTTFLKACVVVFCTSFFTTLQAQVVHQELLQYKQKYPERSVVNVRVVDNVEIDFDKNDSVFMRSTSEHELIYIDKNASRYSEKSVSSSHFYKLEAIEASVLLPSSDKKYKTVKIKQFETEKSLSTDVFYDGSERTKFVLSDLREGAKSIIKETRSLRVPELLPSYYFGSYTNTEMQELSLKVHKGIKMRFHFYNGFDTLTTYTTTEKGDYITHVWKATHLQPIKREGSAPTIRSYIPHIYPVIESYTINNETTPVLRDINDLYAWYETLLSKSEVEDDTNLVAIVDSLVKGVSTEEEKVKEIFDWVQKNIKYVAYEEGLGGFVPRPPRLVFQRKYGDCKDVSFLQVYMAKKAGITKVYPAWVGTRDLPYSYEELAAPGCDNHMIAAYERSEKQFVFLDATGTYSTYGFPSAFIQGKEVLVHKQGEGFNIVEVEPVASSQSTVVDEVSLFIDGANLKGKANAVFTGFVFTDLQYRLTDADSVKKVNYLKSYLEKGSNKFFFTLDSTVNIPHEKGSVYYSFSVDDYVRSNNDELYVNLNLSKLLASEKIENDRTLPIEADYKQTFEYTFKLNTSGYNVTYIPQNSTFTNDKFGFNLTYTQKGEEIVYNIQLVFNYLLLNPEDFKDFNEMVKKLNKAYKEVLVLKRK